MPDPQSTASVSPELTRAFLFNIKGPMRDQEFVLDFVQKSSALKEQFVHIWDEILDNYFVSPHGANSFRIWPNDPISTVNPRIASDKRKRRATLKDPETHQIVETLASQAMGLLLGPREFIAAVPVGLDDPEKARFLSRILMGILEQPGWYSEHYQAFKDAFLLGTAVVEMGWESLSRMQQTPTPIVDENGKLLDTVNTPQEIIYRDAPTFRLIDLYDFFPDPTGHRIQKDMLGVAKRGRITAAMARQLRDGGTYHRTGAVNKALQLAAGGGAKDGSTHATESRSRFPAMHRQGPDDLQMMTFFEYWGQVPYQHPDGASNRVITLLNGEVVRSHINPYVDGNIPFKEIVVNPVAGRFYGLSPAEVNRYLQDSADNYLMVGNDAANAALSSPLLVGLGFGGDMDRLRRREILDVIECRNPDMVKPLPVDLNVLQLAAAERIGLKQNMRESSGAGNTQQAIPSSDRQTATEVSELVRFASQRVEMMVQLIERDDYPWIGRTLHSRLRQFMPPGGGNILFEGENMPFKLEDINHDADVRFVGSRFAMSQHQIMNQYAQTLSVLSTNPNVVMDFPGVVIKLLRDGLHIVEAEAIVAQAQQAVQARMQQQMEMQLALQQQKDAAKVQGGSAPAKTEHDRFRRFQRIATSGLKALMPERVKEAPPPTAAEQRAHKLQQWTREDECTDTFLPYIEARITQLEALEQDNLEKDKGSLQTYYKGRKDEARFYLDSFKAWRDKA
jgi:hypothetical protein